MTQVRFRPRVPDGVSVTGRGVYAPEPGIPPRDWGAYYISPMRKFATNDGYVLPLWLKLDMADMPTVVVLAPSGVAWLWVVREVVLGVPASTRYVQVPDLAGVLDFESLLDIDPETVVPSMASIPAWEAAVDAVQAASNAVSSAVASAALDDGAVRRSLGFLEAQTDALAPVTTDASIAFDRAFPSDWTGAITGSFNLNSVPSPAVVQLCPITVGSPADQIDAQYRGMVYGASTLFGAGYKIQAYKQSPGNAPVATPSVATLDSAGFFGLDLSTTPASTGGIWQFAILNSTNVQQGSMWPQERSYTGLSVELRTITDSAYPVATTPATVNGAFRFPWTYPGRPTVRLKDAAGNILADYSPTVGTVRSYNVSSGQAGYGTNFVHQCYMYDQAVALCAAIAAGRGALAKRLVTGLLQLQSTTGSHTGGFIFSGQQLSPTYGDQAYRTGAHAVGLYALLAYMRAYPKDRTALLTARATAALTFIDGTLSASGQTSGLYLGGYGTYTTVGGGDQGFNREQNLTWASSEHQFDIWHAFTLANKVLGLTGYATKAASLKAAMMSKLWDATAKRFNQGMKPTGLDTADPLDMHSWGAIFLEASGQHDAAMDTLAEAKLAPFQHTSATGAAGYGPVYDSAGYPDAVPTVWAEGTFSLAYALSVTGQHARADAVRAGLVPYQRSNGSFVYVTEPDATYELSPYESVIGSAWQILADARTGIWNF